MWCALLPAAFFARALQPQAPPSLGTNGVAEEEEEEEPKLSFGDVATALPMAMYSLLLVVALWRLFVHRPPSWRPGNWTPKFGFHVFVVCFSVR